MVVDLPRLRTAVAQGRPRLETRPAGTAGMTALDSYLTAEEAAAAAATQVDDTECVCGHPHSDHGDGIVHTACCGRLMAPGASGLGRDVACECDGFEAR